MMVQQQKRQQREEQILLSLNDLTYATRRQLQVVNKLGGDRNAHRILQQMEKDKSICSIRTEQKIYFLSNRGKERIGSTQVELKKSQILHTLMRNDLYILLGQPSDWRKEKPIRLNGEVFLIPDATFKKAGEYHFVEVDNEQTMKTNIDKIKKYKELSSVLFESYKHTPTLIWYSLSELRKEKLKEACIKTGVKFVIY
ncbi:replication-relaxation family protein [Oceanobacillus damuensis]|uniref:replication-relaxation family protein n=1 Tax=Oceanobacillus damuensis TaxID=937928 RepID=UPI001F1A279C|nr:replication-relaxation family protein [Oceanobacillus damuensis]